MSDVTDYAQKVCDQFAKKITDKIFLMIQNDRELMHDYFLLLFNALIDSQRSDHLRFPNAKSLKWPEDDFKERRVACSR